MDRRASKGVAFVATTAPTTPQVEAILWRYTWATPTRRQVSLAASPSTPSGTSATSSSPTARKPADYDPAAFQGIHARYVLVIIDEAGGIPKSIFDAVYALATNIDARVVAVGNPDDPASHFATICKPGSGWHVETISAFDTPAYTGEKVPEELLPLLVSPEWVEERKLRWGHQQPDLPVEAPGGRLETDVPRASQGRHDDHDRAHCERDAGDRCRRRQERLGASGRGRSWRWWWSGGPVGRAESAGDALQRGEAPIDKELFVNARAEDNWKLRERFE